ncbi:hypothetical protein [Acinetobacter guerrae]|uniref:hypothetical protein n=1 Tax=Acinetobacter guerrae TaxID=1843371 RepID=UPI00125F4AD8|nr:hypothetical protein [Acinetobacter guerrae]
MKLYIKRISILIFLFFLFCNVYAEDNFRLNNLQCIDAKKNNGKLDVYLGDCKNKIKKIDSIEIPNDYAKVEYVFYAKNTLYIAFSYNESYRDVNGDFNYADKYFLINAYNCAKGDMCRYNSRLSSYFGNGGNILDLNTNKIVYKYPYSKQSDLKKELTSKMFNDWFGGGLNYGVVIRKTFINETNNFSPIHKSYLVKGDRFQVEEVSARWLNVKYKNKNNKTVKGWISCEDTDICQ